MNQSQALLLVDVQNDFCPGGALPVPNGDQIIPVLNEYVDKFLDKRFPIFASRDWHPKQTIHFKDFGGVWPEHCVQNTQGAEFHPGLFLPPETIIITKGIDPNQDSYSAFQGFDERGNNLLYILRNNHINELYVGGLATDYCVKASAIDALSHGINVTLLIDAIKGVNLNPKDSQKAIEAMVAEGAKIVSLEDWED